MADFDTENGNNDKASNVWNLIFRQIHFDIPNIGFACGAEFPYLLSVTEILLCAGRCCSSAHAALCRHSLNLGTVCLQN
jgi:hypothetical protein